MSNANAAGVQVLSNSNPDGTVLFLAAERLDTTGTVTGFTAGAGTAVLSDSTFTGDSGSTAYTIGDIVLALKTIGVLAA